MDKFIAIATAPHIVAQIGLHPCLQPQTQANPTLVTDPLFAVNAAFIHPLCFQYVQHLYSLHVHCTGMFLTCSALSAMSCSLYRDIYYFHILAAFMLPFPPSMYSLVHCSPLPFHDDPLTVCIVMS